MQEEPVVGLSGLVVTCEDKRRFALQMLKNVTDDDLMTAKDFALEEGRTKHIA